MRSLRKATKAYWVKWKSLGDEYYYTFNTRAEVDCFTEGLFSDRTVTDITTSLQIQ